MKKTKNTENENKSKKPFDKMKLAKGVIASGAIIMMLFSVCGTLLYYLIQK